jgi:hypothetical protein
MLLFVLMPLFLLVALPFLLVWWSGHIALWAKHLAARQSISRSRYPVAEMLEITFEPEPAGVWPPKPTIDPPDLL